MSLWKFALYVIWNFAVYFVVFILYDIETVIICGIAAITGLLLLIVNYVDDIRNKLNKENDKS